MESHKLFEESFRHDTSEYILWIELSIPPLGSKKVKFVNHKSVFECERQDNCLKMVTVEKVSPESGQFELKNDNVNAVLDSNALEIRSSENIAGNSKASINEKLFKYDSIHTKSCVYTFKPTSYATEVKLSNQEYLKYTGSLINGIQVYGSDNDFHYDKTVLVKRGDGALHVTSRNFIKTRHDIELAQRYVNSDMKEMYTGDSLAFIKREYIDYETAITRNLTRSSSKSDKDVLGLSTYPMVDGFIGSFANGSNVGFVNSQACAAHLVSPTDFEFLIARSVMNVNQDKGLPERLYEKIQTHFNYKVFVNNDINELYNEKNKYVGK